MKTLTTKILLFACLFTFSNAMSQQGSRGKEGMWPAFIKYDSNQPDFEQGSIQITDENGERYRVSDVKMFQQEKDEVGMSHYRY